MIKRLLIANRGEIALRIIRACKKMAIETVAVYAAGDEASLHVRLADQSVCIGSASASSYLDIKAILSAAEITQADAVHPGYGFLAENAEFSKAASDLGLCFVGPSHHLIALMGDKINAIDTMRKHGVPTIPGSCGNLPDDPKQQKAIAARIGYPVLIKAAAGGGGRGMLPVYHEHDLVQSVRNIKIQAKQLFANDDVYLEKYLEAPRHIEVQILADQFGEVVCIGDRDCSIQRRHQKIIEEAPAFGIPEKAREQLFATCRRALKKIGYIGVGTIEMLYERGKFYFIEMNTRIQVEHPVSEMVTGIDLIQQQILMHAGQKLALTTDQLRNRGHAIECRINAENPTTMQASPGQITQLHFPGGHGVRVDSHIYAGFRVTHYFDSLIAKIIVHAESRTAAIRVMQHALGETHIAGVETNIPLHKNILASDMFQTEDIHIHFLTKVKELSKPVEV